MEKLHWKARFVQGGADEFFLEANRARSHRVTGLFQGNALVGGETTGLARSHRKTWSVTYNEILHKIKTRIRHLR